MGTTIAMPHVVGVALGASVDMGFSRIFIVIEGMVGGLLTASERSITNICNRFLAWERRVASRFYDVITFGSTPNAGSMSGEATTDGHDLFPDTAQSDGGGTHAATPTPSNKIAPQPAGHPLCTLLEQCYLISFGIFLSSVYASMTGING